MNLLTPEIIEVAEKALDSLDEMQEQGVIDEPSNNTRAFNMLMAVDPLITEEVDRVKAEIWRECFEWCSDMFAMPADFSSPYE